MTEYGQNRKARGEALYALHRSSVKNDLRSGRMLARLNIADVSEDDVDETLNEEQ